MSDSPNLVLPRSDLDALMATLDVEVIGLIECLVSPGWRLSFGSADAPSIHYNLSGTGRMVVGGFSAFALVPHTLVITPAKTPFHIEVDDRTAAKTVNVVEAQWDPRFGERVQRFVAGDVDPMVMLICGYFRATYGSSIDLFAGLSTPIVERFEPGDELGSKLQAALAEISGRQVGMQAMTTAILKQVLVTLVRRSLNSTSVWLERFSILSDRQIALAFADMVARPSADHSVMALAQKAGLSRSAFMARFVRAIGCSPMVALRQMRMKRAADMLAARTFSVEQIARAVGYRSCSSFLRAFRQAHGYAPAETEGEGRSAPPALPGESGAAEDDVRDT
ncbi:helix-turn-helix domain-containing protein [Bradyrhizobium canariense]|uniref:helix-turn-helix domain-containing protein n=1 Tax=Bradyrhizobium canariense TaxID=255045 RepID=UPI001CA498BA|nr:helix-turn-helix domain-containing protein [Bradyrhizobium canariense]MBW5437570.1 helix-turn-helix domain-containing protein [Bradyrhizobium canariense]